MISARFTKRQGRLVGFSVSGHAGYAAQGEDLVCACVSSAVQLVVNTLTECCRISAAVEVLENQIICTLPEDCTAEFASQLLEGLRLHLTLLEQDYPHTIELTEV